MYPPSPLPILDPQQLLPPYSQKTPNITYIPFPFSKDLPIRDIIFMYFSDFGNLFSRFEPTFDKLGCPIWTKIDDLKTILSQFPPFLTTWNDLFENHPTSFIFSQP